MKPLIKKIDVRFDYSFSVREDIIPYFDSRWFYHPELELTLIRKGSGVQFVGDGIHRFRSGDIFLLGSNLPHLWRSDEEYFDSRNNLQVEVVTVHFLEEFWGEEFLNLPEVKPIKKLFEIAKKGIRLKSPLKELVSEKMEDMLQLKGASRIANLLNISYMMSVSSDYKLLSSTGFTQQIVEENAERINLIYHYTFNNFQDEITIEKVSGASNLSPNYFCRYFKSVTKKTYWQFLREIRIGYACKLLVEGVMNVSEISFSCGFNNQSNFNRQFKLITGKTPLEYREDYLHSQI